MRNQCGKRILPAYPHLITTSKTLMFFRNAEMEQDLKAPLTRLERDLALVAASDQRGFRRGSQDQPGWMGSILPKHLIY